MSSGWIAAFIQRPILASVVSLLIIVSGLAALNGVEVRELPDVDQPVVSIRTAYPGANPESIDAEVTAVIESAVAQVDGVVGISSSSSYGSSRVTAEFSNSIDINVASTDVQNAVSSIGRDLPEDIEEPVVIKADTDASPIMRLAISAENMDPGDLADLVDDVILPRLQAIEGVAQADDYGVRNQVIRVRVFPPALFARGFSVEDVNRALASAAINAPSGALRTGEQQLLIRTEAQASTPEEIGALRLDEQTRLSDVAAVEWGYEDNTTAARVDGNPGIGIGIIRQAQSNTVTVARGVRQAVEELEQSLPASININVTVDDSIFIERAISEVFKSLLMATSIVVLVIFLFLKSPRATIIPAVTIPVSILGTLAAIWLAGFSLNLITLLALVMATGLVVDDAIVVTENIQRWRKKGVGKRAAALLGTREIVFAVLSTTATLAAVFIPISFLPGQAGKLFSEFGFVLAFSVMVSSLVALTLCPVMTIRFGRAEAPDAEIQKPRGLTKLYNRAISFLLKFPALPVLASLVFGAGAYFTFFNTPTELTPVEDRGRVFMLINGQDGASFDFLDRRMLEMEARLESYVEKGEAESIMSLARQNFAFVVLILPDWAERDKPQQAYEGEIRRMLGNIPGAIPIIRRGNSLGIRGAGQGLQFAVTGDDYFSAADGAEQIVARLQETELFSNVRLNFQISQPQISVKIDREAASILGIPVSAIGSTIQAMADEFRAAEIYVGDDIIEILVSNAGEPVDDPTDLANLFMQTPSGVTVPLSSVATIEEVPVAANLAREQRRRAVPVTAALAEGVRLGDAIATMRDVAGETLDGSLSVTLLGEARLLQQSNNSTSMVFAFAALVVLLVLAAQFESFISALIIMVTVPFGLAAAVYAISLTGGSINYYSQIGLVLLIGIMAKNGILIVEFANQLRSRGRSVREAIEEASVTRFRPVLMTALSTLLGGLPLVLGTGAGAESRAALGWVVVGGLGFATVFTLFLTPVAYLLLAGLSRPRGEEAKQLDQELAAAPVA